MKIFTLTIFSSLLAASVLAQAPVQQPSISKEANLQRVPYSLPSSSRAATATTELFNYGNELSSIGNNLNYFINFAFPDSTVQVEFGDGFGAVWKHSFGQVFDPYSTIMQLNHPPLDTIQDYTLDAVHLYYNYWRFQTGAPDTLVVQVIDHSDIGLFPAGLPGGVSLALVDYDSATVGAQSPSTEIKYLLEDKDTATNAVSSLTIPLGLTVGAREKVAVLFTYLPGNPVSIGDTIDPFVVGVGNRINAFSFYEYEDEDQTIETGFYNHEIMATSTIRYGTDVLGWYPAMLPGVAFIDGYFHLDVDFEITYEVLNIGLDETLASNAAKLYPNPVVAGTGVQLSLDLPQATTLDLTVTDLRGRTIVQGEQLTAPSGKSIQQLNLPQLQAGAYLVRLVDDRSTLTLPLQVH